MKSPNNPKDQAKYARNDCEHIDIKNHCSPRTLISKATDNEKYRHPREHIQRVEEHPISNTGWHVQKVS